jgi:hypothetical protein
MVVRSGGGLQYSSGWFLVLVKDKNSIFTHTNMQHNRTRVSCVAMRGCRRVTHGGAHWWRNVVHMPCHTTKIAGNCGAALAAAQPSRRNSQHDPAPMITGALMQHPAQQKGSNWPDTMKFMSQRAKGWGGPEARLASAAPLRDMSADYR